ncbi:MAG: HAD-IA family hydrolase [Xanthobacteraceae bacterium]
MTSAPVDALLFDLGNVVIRIDFDRVFARWAVLAGCDAGQLRERFSYDEAYQRHERDEIDTSVYFASLRDTLGVGLDDACLLDGWNAVFVEEMPGMSMLLARIAPKIPLYAFTNTNRAHAAHYARRFAPVLGHFRKVFASYEMGLRKPEPASFAHIGTEIGVPAPRILFFDDTLANVDAARACGLEAVHVASDETVGEAVATLGL